MRASACLGEHGDFVEARLADGYGALAAAGTTLRRLKMHLVDPVNLEPLALLVPAGAVIARGSVRGRALALAIGAQILAYAPFYFDGNYPAGGARFFCDVLPVEHVLVAVAVADLAARRRAPLRWGAGAVALALVGFAVRSGFDHASLRDRDGGRPLFEPAVVARAGVTRGLLFVDTDHGFDLAFDPGGAGDLDVARFHGDALDRFAWAARGRPPAFRYRFLAPPDGGLAQAFVEPLAFPPLRAGEPRVIEGASLWPALAQSRGWAIPEWVASTCAATGHWLAIRRAPADAPAERRPATVTLGLPAAALAGCRVSARLAAGAGARGEVELSGERVPFAAAPGAITTCLDLPSIAVSSSPSPPALSPPLSPPLPLPLTVRIEAGAVALDALLVEGCEND